MREAPERVLRDGGVTTFSDLSRKGSLQCGLLVGLTECLLVLEVSLERRVLGF